MNGPVSNGMNCQAEAAAGGLFSYFKKVLSIE